MPRKVTLPGSPEPLRPVEPHPRLHAESQPPSRRPEAQAVSRGTGRVRHEEKITVYVSREELVRLEQARLGLRAEYGLALDRGRIVREAVAAALDELEAQGPDSDLLRRLAES